MSIIFSVNELSNYIDKTLELSKRELVKSNVERAGLKVLPQIKLPTRKISPSAPKCSEQYNSSIDCECQVCRVLKVQLGKRSPSEKYSSPFLSILARDRVGKPNVQKQEQSIVTEYWSTPFSSNEFRNGARKYGSASAYEDDFIRSRRMSLIRDEINSLKKTSKKKRSSDSKYFFRDLNELRSKLVSQEEEEYSFLLHNCPAPKFKSSKERFDVAAKYKQNVRLSKDIREFIDKQRDILKNRPERTSLNESLGRKRASSLFQSQQTRKNSDKIVAYEPPILDDNDPNNYALLADEYLNEITLKK